ncbi:MAG: efflux RND transporter periplasmic adaptor subunit [Pseudomonadota bacterium]
MKSRRPQLTRWASLVGLLVLQAAGTALAQDRSVSSLGRIEPDGGIVQVAGPSGGCISGSVIRSLEVQEGDWVEEGQIVAYLDSYDLHKAEVARLQAVYVNASSEMERQNNLSLTSATSKVKLDQAVMDLAIAEADLAASRARLDLSVVRAPVAAQVLEIHAAPGERVGVEGVLELGRTNRMYVVAEVYETDISLVAKGQRASINLAALSQPLSGTVERVSLKVGRLDVIGTDPVDKTDARVVEVYILLDDSAAVSGYTNMQVEVEISA